MATIIKRKSKYSVVYYVVDENGVKRQKWESFDTNAAARKRKAEIEHQQDTNTFIAPSALTLSDLLDQYVTIYGVNTWAPSTYEGHKSLIDNYIQPLIGDRKLDDINPRMMDHFYKQLKTVKAKARPYGVPKDGFSPPPGRYGRFTSCSAMLSIRRSSGNLWPVTPYKTPRSRNARNTSGRYGMLRHCSGLSTSAMRTFSNWRSISPLPVPYGWVNCSA